jgi:hypothetical protein
MKRSLAAALLALLGAVPLACGSKVPIAARPHKALPAASARASAAAVATAAAAVRARHIVTLGDKTLGPFVAAREGAGLAAYVAPEGGAHRVFALPLTADGAVRGEVRDLGKAMGDASTLVIRPAGRGAGFLVAWTALADKGEGLFVAATGDDGTPRAPAVELARTASHLVWVDVVPTAKGAVCVWVEETRAGETNLLAAALDADGKLRGVPARVARGLSGWQAVATSKGVALAVVAGDAASKVGKGGTLTLQELDDEGAPVGLPVPVVTKPSVSGDVELVAGPAGLTFAWTDRTGSEPVVMTSSIDASGRPQAARPAVEARGGSALLALVAGSSGTALAWEEPQRRPRTARTVRVTRLADAGGPARTVALDLAGRAPPELVADGAGFALLARAQPCKRGEPAEACGDAAAMPVLVRLDASMTPVQTEPVWLGDPATAGALAWGLRCQAGACAALAATPESPARVFSFFAGSRASAYVAPETAAPSRDGPHVAGLTTVASGADYADIAVTKVDGGALVALVTAAVDARGQGAQVVVRPVDTAGKPLGAPVTLTTRALTAGGVAIAAGGTPDDGAAVAWVARENGDPEVHVTRIDKRGKRQNDVQLTTAKGSASDVAIGWADGGWIVAWVDGRDGNGEVYATKVGTDLSRVAREERITTAPGDASDVTMLVRPNAVWLAWSDPRESPSEGFADVFVTSLRPRDAKRSTDEVRLLASAAHSRSPSLAPAGDAIAVAWIEEAPHDARRSAAHGAMMARVDKQGTLLGPPVRMQAAGAGHPTSVALDASSGALRAVVARATHDDLTLDGVDLTEPGPGRAFVLHALDAPPTLDVAMSPLDGALFFNDESGGERRAVRALIDWKR